MDHHPTPLLALLKRLKVTCGDNKGEGAWNEGVELSLGTGEKRCWFNVHLLVFHYPNQ